MYGKIVTVQRKCSSLLKYLTDKSRRYKILNKKGMKEMATTSITYSGEFLKKKL